MFLIHHIRFFLGFTTALFVVAALSVAVFGFTWGIEFTGGSLTEVEYAAERPALADIERSIGALPFSSGIVVQPTGEKGYLVRAKDLNEDERQTLRSALSLSGTAIVEEKQYTLVGPSIGEELRRKAWIAIALVVFAIALFIAFAFRSKSTDDRRKKFHIGGWHYGAIACIALIHDLVIPAGVFAFLGSKFIAAQIDTLFVVAMLTILGFSVHDTIVTFDRVREHVRRVEEDNVRKTFRHLVGESVSETFTRSINTSVSVLFALLALLVFGPAATTNFALVLIIGVIAGTYSSIALAAALLVIVEERLERRAA